jgi:hypothetical protein
MAAEPVKRAKCNFGWVRRPTRKAEAITVVKQQLKG